MPAHSARLLPALKWRSNPSTRKLSEPVVRILFGSHHANLPEAMLADLIDVVPGIGDFLNAQRVAGALTEKDRALRGKRASLQAVDFAVGSVEIPGVGTAVSAILDFVTPTNILLYLDEQGRLPSGMIQDLVNAGENVGEVIGNAVEHAHTVLDVTKLPVPGLSSGVARVGNVPIQAIVCAANAEGPIRCIPKMWDRLTEQRTVNMQYPFLRGKRNITEYFDDAPPLVESARMLIKAGPFPRAIQQAA